MAIKRRTGRWTREEHAQFQAGEQKHGWGKWCEIATAIPTRNRIQVKTHAQKVNKHTGNAEIDDANDWDTGFGDDDTFGGNDDGEGVENNRNQFRAGVIPHINTTNNPQELQNGTCYRPEAVLRVRNIREEIVEVLIPQGGFGSKLELAKCLRLAHEYYDDDDSLNLSNVDVSSFCNQQLLFLFSLFLGLIFLILSMLAYKY